MGYKRKACILFVGSGSACLAQVAAAFAAEIGGDCMEARAAGFRPALSGKLAVKVMEEAGVDIRGQAPELLSDALLEWADLVVTLDEEADRRCPPLPAGVRKRHYTFACPPVAADMEVGCRALREQVRVAVEGIVGGMRMMEKAGREEA